MKEKHIQNEALYLTPRGYRSLEEEFVELRTVERPKVVKGVADAAAEGDRSENAEYIYGKKKLREIDKRLSFLKGVLDKARVVDPNEKREGRAFFSAVVTVADLDNNTKQRFILVGMHETHLYEGGVSIASPIGKALLGRSEGDEVTVRTPGGLRTLEVIEIRYDATLVV